MTPSAGRMDVFRPLPDGRFERTRQLSADDVVAHDGKLAVSHQSGHLLTQYDAEGRESFSFQVDDATHIGEVRHLGERYLVRTGLGLLSLDADNGKLQGEFRFGEFGFQRRLAETDRGLAVLDQGLVRHFSDDLKPLGTDEVGFLGNSIERTPYGLMVGEGYPGRLVVLGEKRYELSGDAREGARVGKDGRIWFIEGQTRRGEPKTVVGWSPEGEVRFAARVSTHALVPLDSGQVLLWEGRDFALHAGDGAPVGTYSIGPEALLKQFFLSEDQKHAFAVTDSYARGNEGQRLLKLDLTVPGSVTDLGPVPEGEHPLPHLERLRMDSLCQASPAKTVLDWEMAGPRLHPRLEKTDVVDRREAPPLLARDESAVIPGMTKRVGRHEIALERDGLNVEGYRVRLQHQDEVTSALGLEAQGRSYVAVGTASGQVLWCDLDGGVERFQLDSGVTRLVARDDRLYALGADGEVGVLRTPGASVADGRGAGVREQEDGILIGSVRVPRRK